jgi:hypothetical protein
MVEPSTRPLSKAVVAVLLLLGGLVSAATWRFVGASEHQAYSPGATPPAKVHVTINKTYHLAVPGGVGALKAAGVAEIASSSGGSSVLGLQCVWSVNGTQGQTLPVSSETVDTKAVDTVGAFVAPASGMMHIRCDNWGTMFVPDADGHPGDPAGWYLILSIVLLTVGAGLGLSALRSGSATGGESDERVANWRDHEESEQIRRYVDQVAGRAAEDGRDDAADAAET